MKSIQKLQMTVAVALAFAFASASFAQNVAVNVASEKQLVRGFGGINLPEWAGSDLSTAQQATAFGNGDGQLGMSVLRIWVSDNKADWSKAVPTAKAAIAKGAIVFATPWYPPSTMRTNTGSSTAKYTMNTASFPDYVTHLNDFIAFMKTNGVDLYAISIQNEPDYAKDWTYWSADQVYQFTLNYAGKINTKVISAESFQYTKTLYDKILNDPKALANIDIVGTHTYGTQVSAFPYALFDTKAAPEGKERWMTEHYTESSNDADLWPLALDVGTDIHNSMVEGQFSVYTWWFIRRKYSPMKEDGNISKRGYCFAQYSKFVRPGFHRVDATKNPSTNVLASAYFNKADGTVVLVVVNKGTTSAPVNFTLSGTDATDFAKYTTSGTKNLVKDGVLTATGGKLSSTVDAQSVTTFVAKGTLGIQGRTTTDLTKFGEAKAYDLHGKFLGTVDGSKGLHEQVAKLATHGGVYFVKSLDGAQSLRVVLTDR